MAAGALRPGDEIGGYVVVRPLGAGGSGTVVLVRDDGGALAALKTVDGQDDPVVRERLRREVNALMAVRHPAVPEVLDAELDGDQAFVVFAYVRGQSLADHVAENGPLVGEELAQTAQRIADALEAAHAAGVVHRDVTPSNIMMSPEGAVLIDFGLSHRTDDERLTKEGLVSGTAGYVAPEVIDGEAPGPAADRWSWAASIAYAMTGRAPFGTGPGAIRATLAGKWRPPAVMGAEALALALSPRPQERPGMRDVVAALRGATLLLPQGGDDAWDDSDADAADNDGQDGEGWYDADGGWHEGDLDDPDALVLRARPEAWEPEPAPRRTVQLAAWTLAGAMIAGLAPVMAVLLVTLCAVIARTLYRRALALAAARARRGVRRRDEVVQTIALPVHVVRSLVEQLPALLAAVLIGGGIGAMWWLAVSWGAIAPTSDEGQALGHAGALIAGTLAGQAVLWWGPWQWQTREGAHRLLAGLAPTRGVSAAWTLVALAATAVVLGAVLLGAGVWWWPLPPMPTP